MSTNMVVKSVVRGKEVLVLNNRKAVTLALDATTFDGQDLQWMLEVLKEELTHRQEDLEGTGGPRKKGRTSKEPQRLEELIAKTKQILKEHGKAKAVWFNRRGFFEAKACDGQHKKDLCPRLS